MNIRKIVSGISAFAVAVTAFAAVTVTASATDYNNISVTPDTTFRVRHDGGGIFTTGDNSSSNYSGVIADLSGLKDIEYATTVTVQFDTYVSYNATTKSLRKLMYGVGNKAQRSLTANAFRNHIGSYSGDNAAGLVTYFGSENGSNYKVYDDNNNEKKSYSAATAYGYNVRTTVTLNRDNDTYTARLQAQKGSGDPIILAYIENEPTTVDNLTVIEAVTWGEASYADLTFKNITVSYTVEVPTVETKEVVLGDLGTDDGVYAKAFTSDITYNGIGIDNVKVDVSGSNEGSQTHTLGHIESDVRIGIILASEKESIIQGIETSNITVTPNATVE